ncbi:MAG: tyrosine-type recombinase/integrase [Candidatus Nanopelagicales bacterium]|nr:tyrosine-type recombinase/integrase [Candidatus Nanopelagicales bacterium]
MIRRYRQTRWQARVTVRDPARSRGYAEISRTFDTRREAEKWEATRKREERARRTPDARLKLSVYAEKVWPIVSMRWKEKTAAGMRGALTTRVFPMFGSVRVSDIRSTRIDAAVAEWLASGVSASTIADSLAAMNAVLDYAWRDGAIDQNPVRMVRRPVDVRPKPSRPALTLAQVRRLADLCLVSSRTGTVTVYRDLVLCLGTTGLRFGEAIALRAADLDLPRGRLLVSRSFVEVDGRLVLQTPKSGRSRTVPVPGFLADVLRARVANLPLTALVFEGRNGAPIRNNTLRKAVWNRVVRSDPMFAGMRIHDLRSAALTNFSLAGVPITDVQQIAGHSSLVVTSRYARPREDAVSRAAAALDAFSTDVG